MHSAEITDKILGNILKWIIFKYLENKGEQASIKEIANILF